MWFIWIYELEEINDKAIGMHPYFIWKEDALGNQFHDQDPISLV